MIAETLRCCASGSTLGLGSARVITLRTEDTDTKAGVALFYGKGRKARVVPFGAKTAAAVLAYQRERRKHPHADAEQLFIGQRGPLSYFGAYRIVRGRAEDVGLSLHPHQTGSATAGTRVTCARSADGTPRTSCAGTEHSRALVQLRFEVFE